MTALDYVMGSFRNPREFLDEKTVDLALTEFDTLRTVELAARRYVERPSKRTRRLLMDAVSLLPAEVPA